MLFSIIGYLFWDYYTSFGTITFKPSWDGILTNSIKNDFAVLYPWAPCVKINSSKCVKCVLNYYYTL